VLVVTVTIELTMPVLVILRRARCIGISWHSAEAHRYRCFPGAGLASGRSAPRTNSLRLTISNGSAAHDRFGARS
jgi:hypothetical protein